MSVLIVGSGPTGLTAALELARSGVDVRIVEKRQTPSGFSRAVGILPNSLRLLSTSGVSEQLMAEGIKIQDVDVHRNAQRILGLSFAGTGVDPDCIVALAQDRTESILRSALREQSIEVEYGMELAGISQNESRVLARFASGDELSVDHLLGADGVESVTRKELGIDYIGYDLPETWSIADVDASGWAGSGSLTLFLLDGGEVALVVPLEQNRYRVISNTPDALATLPLTMDIKNIRRAGEFNISVRQAQTYRKGRVFLAGDSAHCHSPVGGRGMNLGIADAVEFATRMASGETDGYSESRHQVGQETIRVSERVRALITSQGTLTKSGVILGMRLVNRAPLLNRFVAKQFLT
jgi:2-polyprenyl-6-methoxyphenol hydroxylase-like FAD-dependent oxidoreductase